MRLVFAGTPVFAQNVLAALHAGGHDIALVLTQPDRPAGRGMQLQASAVKQYAQQHGLALAQPTSLRLEGKYPEEAAAAQGRAAAQAEVLLAAHGSFRSSAPSEVAQAVAQRLKRAGFARAEAFFIDQEPRIATATGFGAGSVCLPFFAAEGGHVTDDLPQALAEASFGGQLLPPLGLDARVPSLIAAGLRG